MTDRIAGRASGPSLRQRRQRAAFWFLAPMLFALCLVAAWPLARTIWFSLTNTTLSNLYGGEWIGFDNYLSMRTLSSGKVVWRGTLVDPAWWNAVWNTVRTKPPLVRPRQFRAVLQLLSVVMPKIGRAHV